MCFRFVKLLVLSMTFMFQTASLACEDLMCAVVAADAFRVKQLINEGANPSRLYSIDSKNPNAPWNYR